MENLSNQIIQEVSKVIVGKDDVIRKVWMVILGGGHVLLEDVPGVGKTTMALSFSKVLGFTNRRIQFTPDVMPSDVVGFYYYDKKKSQFTYKEGVVMTNLLIADEINRTSSRTQAALLEVMEEKTVTVDGVTHKVPNPFFVIATQNPVGSAGTQLLPESQLDRFMAQLSMGYPTVEEEMLLMENRSTKDPLDQVNNLLTPSSFLWMKKNVEATHVSRLIYRYVALLSEATRKHDMIRLGVSPRGSLALIQMAKARAYLDERNYVIPEDVQDVVFDVFKHRLILKSKARLALETTDSVIADILKNVQVPDDK